MTGDAAEWVLFVAVFVGMAFLWWWLKRKVRTRPIGHVHNWDYQGESRWSKDNMRMEHIEYCIAGQECDQIVRYTPWEKDEYRLLWSYNDS